MNDYTGSTVSVAALIVAGLIWLIFVAGFYVLSSIFMMKIFEKAGVQGKWRAWVPVYNSMIFLKLGDLSPWLIFVFVLGFVPILNFFVGIALAALFLMAAWRVGLKLQKEAVWVVLYFFLSIVWMGINAFDKSRWNPNIAPAPWAGNGFLGDRTVWEGVPVQPAAAAPPAAGAPYGQPPQGYQPPAPQGYAPPATPAAPPVVPPTADTPPAPPAPPVPPAPPAPPAPSADGEAPGPDQNPA